MHLHNYEETLNDAMQSTKLNDARCTCSLPPLLHIRPQYSLLYSVTQYAHCISIVPVFMLVTVHYICRVSTLVS